jgi:hypothetical protein
VVGRWAVIAGIVVVVLAGAGLLGFSIAGGRAGRRRSAAAVSGYAPSSGDPATAANETALAFLSAWSGGRLEQAAAYTDAPGPAYAACGPGPLLAPRLSKAGPCSRPDGKPVS